MLVLGLAFCLLSIGSGQLPKGGWPELNGNSQQTKLGLGANTVSTPTGGISTGITTYYGTGPILGQNGYIYVVSATTLNAFSLTTGAQAWTLTFTNYLPAGDPVVDANGTVYFAVSYNGTDSSQYQTGIFYALNGATGAQIWKYKDSAFKCSPIMGPDGTLYVGVGGSPSYGGTGTGLVAINSSTGKVVWRQTDLVYDYPFTSPVFGTDGNIYAPGDYNVGQQACFSIYAINPADGSVEWKAPQGATVLYPSMGANGYVYYLRNEDAGTCIGAIDPTTQQTVWTSTPIPSNAGAPAIAPNGDLVLLEYGTLVVYDYDGTTGNLRWSTPLPSDYDGLTGPIIGQSGEIYVTAHSDHVYDGNSNYFLGQLVALSEVTGNIDWTWTDDGDYAEADMAMDQNGTIYVPIPGGIEEFRADLTASLTLNPTVVLGGNSVQATVTLSSAAPLGGAAAVITGTPAGIPPQTVTIPAGQATVTFTLNTTAVGAVTLATVAAGPGPATAALTINPPTIVSCTLNPTSVVGGNTSTGTVTIGSPAPSGGLVISLACNSPAGMVPPTMTVPAGQTVGTFTVNTEGVSLQTTAIVTASFGQRSSSAALQIQPASLTSLAFSPNSVLGSTSSTGTVTLNGIAPAGGLAIALSSGNSAASVPATVNIAGQSQSATFTVTTVAVSSNQSATITATLGSASQQAVLAVNAPSVQSVVLSPTTVLGGSSSSATVTLSGPGAVGGTPITLSSGSTSATVPAAITVASGKTTATFTVTTVGVNSQTSASITATLGASSQSTVLTITPAALLSVQLNPTTLQGGATSTATVTLGGPAAPNGTTVALSSNNSDATAPTSVTVPGGATTATFNVSTLPTNTALTATITATLNGTQKAATLSVWPAAIQSLSLNPTSVIGGNSSTGTITLSGPAGAGGAIVAVSSSNASATVPATVTVPAGLSTTTFTVSTVGVATSGAATISAVYNAVTEQATLSITASSIQSVSLNPSTVAGTTPSTGTVLLTGQAPPGGFVVNLASSSPSATVPSSVSIPAGSSSATFKVTSTPVTALTSVTITATLAGRFKATTLTQMPEAVLSVDISPSSVPGGQSASGVVTLNGVAPKGGVSVKLTSSLSEVTVPTSVSVPAGSTTATFAVKTTPVAKLADATVTAKVGTSSAEAGLTVEPPALQSLTIAPSSVAGGSPATGTVTLTGAAPAGGLTVKLSVNQSTTTLPTSATVPAGKTSVTFPVKTIPVTAQVTATVNAVSNGLTETATLTVTPSALISVKLSPTSVAGGKSSTGTVTVSGPAPTGGLVIALSTNTSDASVPSTVAIPPGKTSATFTVKTVKVGLTTPATISATLSGSTVTALLTIT